MENFVNNTEVSFSQLTKKGGWFSRLIFIQSIMNFVPPLVFLAILDLDAFNTGYLVTQSVWIVSAWIICLLLWKKRTRFTITVSIIFLWIQLIFKRMFGVLGAVLLLLPSIFPSAVYTGTYEAHKSLLNYRIGVLIYAIVFAVTVLVLTVVWTRNLRQLKRLQP